MKSSDTSIDKLIAGGILGAALGELLSKDKEDGAVIGALLGAGIAATAKASEEAKKTNIPQLSEENGNLYEISITGEKRFIKTLNKSANNLPEQFKLT